MWLHASGIKIFKKAQKQYNIENKVVNQPWFWSCLDHEMVDRPHGRRPPAREEISGQATLGTGHFGAKFFHPLWPAGFAHKISLLFLAYLHCSKTFVCQGPTRCSCRIGTKFNGQPQVKLFGTLQLKLSLTTNW